MSFSSAFKTAPTKLFNTSNLSTVASVGIHAILLGVALPGLPIFSQKENTSERLEDVGLIELTPAEQSRLPNLSQPSPLDPSTYPGVPPIDPSLFNTPSSLPNQTQGGIDPSLLPAPPNSLSFGNGNTLSVVPPPPPTSYYPSPNTWSNSLPALPSSPPTPQNLSLPPQMQTSNAELQRPDFAPVRGAIDPRDLINQRNSAIAQGNLPQRTAANSEAGQRPMPPDPKQTLQEIRIRRLVAESIQGAESLIADRKNTTNEEAMRNDVRWRTKTGDAKPIELSISGNYPRNACMRRLEGTSVYGVVVNTQGQVANSSPPYLIKSAGYQVFNQQALRDIYANRFANQTGQPKSFLVRVNYAYNEKLCPSVAVASPQPRKDGVPRQGETLQPAPTGVNPAPTKPNNAPAESEAIAPNQRQPEGKTPTLTIPRQDSEAIAPNQSKPRLEMLPPITPKKVPEASEAAEPRQQQQPRVEISVPTSPRKAPEANRTNEPTSSRKTPEASEATSATNPRRNSEPSSAEPTNNRKISPIRPLGAAAPRKTSEESSNSSETPSENSQP
jgi:TonB family protein